MQGVVTISANTETDSMHLAIGRGPVEVALFVLDVPVERGDRRIDQLGHHDSNQW